MRPAAATAARASPAASAHVQTRRFPAGTTNDVVSITFENVGAAWTSGTGSPHLKQETMDELRVNPHLEHAFMVPRA